MRKATRKSYSQHLRRTMKYRVYGDRGKPVIAFPTSEAHFRQWEDFDMVDALSVYIDDGDITLYTVDSIDEETFFRHDRKRKLAMQRYEQYLAYLTEELFPTILKPGQKAMLVGCSMGAYHAANVFFRWPQFADSVIALSGVYTPKYFLGTKMPPYIRINSPLDYLQDPIGRERRRRYTASKLVFCAGQGAGEEDMLNDTVELAEILEAQRIPAWVDVWGEDATHDWPWWHDQMAYFMYHVLEASHGPRPPEPRRGIR